MLETMTPAILPRYLSKFSSTLSPCRFAAKKISEFSMEKVKYPEGNMDFKKEAECVGKEACESDTTKMKRLSDNIMPHILNLYGSCATSHDFEIYREDASFEDPLMCAQGVTEKVISAGKQEILIDNKQQYKFWGRNIDMISLIKLDIEDGKVVRHEDWWDKKPLRNRETVDLPLVGRFIELSRRGSMLATHALMGFGKDQSG